MIDRKHCRAHSDAMRETKDCSVRACACAAQIDYPSMHEYLAHYGRKPRDGMHGHLYRRALEDLGFKVTKLDGPQYRYESRWVRGFYKYDRWGNEVWINDHYRCKRRKVSNGKDYSSATVRSLQKELTVGTFLVQTDAHVLCMRDGVVEDHTDGRLHRIEEVYRVEM